MGYDIKPACQFSKRFIKVNGAERGSKRFHVTVSIGVNVHALALWAKSGFTLDQVLLNNGDER